MATKLNGKGPISVHIYTLLSDRVSSLKLRYCVPIIDETKPSTVNHDCFVGQQHPAVAGPGRQNASHGLKIPYEL